jgi:hypothetical protein
MAKHPKLHSPRERAPVIGLLLSAFITYSIVFWTSNPAFQGFQAIVVGFIVYFSAALLYFGIDFRRDFQNQWAEHFGIGFDLWNLSCQELCSGYSNGIYCGVSDHELILMPVHEWCMARDWPMEWIESVELNDRIIRLQLRGRPIIELSALSTKQAQQIHRTIQGRRAKQ